MKSVCIIPARGGSKRIPRKNIKDFCGKPMIAHSIETAQRSNLFVDVYVTTEDKEIADIARNYGARIIDRPLSLADDYTGTHDVVKHAVSFLIESGVDFDSICCLYATAPFVELQDLSKGKEKLLENKWKGVVAATDFSFPVFRSFKHLDSGGLEMLFPEHYKTRSQDLPTIFHDAGQFYWMKKHDCLGEAIGFGASTEIVMIPHWRVQDIDTSDDWSRAEMIWKIVRERKK